ncbi:CBS domain-containing protein [Candidatus Saccharibacteria bacterium]|nr:CBS domain-containing protein [Candidatus Saccharibacteria bacterium]
MHIIINIILASVALLAISLERTYRRVPPKELKRRARSGDEMANMLYRAVSYGPSLKVVLWGLIAITNTIFFIYLVNNSPVWFAAFAIIAVVWFGFLWLPARDVTKYGNWFAVKLAPLFGWLLEYIHPFVQKIGNYIESHRPLSIHTGLYEKEDLIELIDKQQIQTENRIDKAELEMVKHVLKFGDKIVADYLIPRRTVKSVSINDSVGPVLIDELHKSGHSRFPVYDGKKDNIVGILYFRDIADKEDGGKVSKYTRKGIFYIHEEESLYQVLQAAIKIRQHLFIVVNNFEEYVGIISVEDVIEQIIGSQLVDEFDQYDDIRAVASKMAKAEHQEHQKNSHVDEEDNTDEKEPKNDTEKEDTTEEK